MTKRCPTPILLVCALVGAACGSEQLVEPERPAASITLNVSPSDASIWQGGSATVAATLTRSSGFSGSVNLMVTGMATGIAAVVSNVQTSGLVTTATVTLNASASTPSGTYNLVVHGRGLGVSEATAAFALTVEPRSCSAGGVCEQWATGATASSQYTATGWSANQATGQPDVIGCEDDARAWASLESNGIEWLELSYTDSVRPTEIRIHEVLGVSSIVKVEVKDGAGTYHAVHAAQPESKTCPRVLTIPVTGISEMVRVVRLSFDQRVLNAWNEIDAVQLIGQTATAPATGNAEFSGVYELEAPITSFDPAWGDLTGCRYKAVLTLQQNSRNAFNGTYADLQVSCPGDASTDWTFSGFVTGSLDPDGRATVQLVGGNHTWTSWYGSGRLALAEIAGDFGCCGHISGNFTVKPRAP
jgi:hypothetical protein